MERISQGRIEYRTALLEAPQAAAFAACLSANPLFAHAHVVESNQTKNATRRWFVAYQPSSPERQAAIAARQQEKRIARAAEEGDRYIWVSDAPRPVWLLIASSGGTYEVYTNAQGQAVACNCPDSELRCQDAGLLCKHLIAHRTGLGRFYTLEQFQSPAALEHWHSLHGPRAEEDEPEGETEYDARPDSFDPAAEYSALHAAEVAA